MIFRQLIDSTSSTYTYLLADENTRDAILIDPVFEQHGRDVALLRELDLNLRATLDTHVHADHITGAWLMKKSLGSKILLSGRYGLDCTDVAIDHGTRAMLEEDDELASRTIIGDNAINRL